MDFTGFAPEALEPRLFLATHVVTTTADSGPGSLRQAIITANAQRPEPAAIHFNIPGPSVHTIEPANPLPALLAEATIDGTTEPGYAGSPLIELSGRLAGSSSNAIGLEGSRLVVRGLTINRWAIAGVRLTYHQTFNSIVEANWVGLNSAGTAAAPNGFHGVEIRGTSRVRVGGTTPAQRNVISGNLSGVFIGGLSDRSATFNTVVGNYIGTDASGLAAVGNTSAGVRVADYTSSNVIGGTEVGEGNVIAGNKNGVLVGRDQPSARGPQYTRVLGNWVGLGAAGAALGNEVGVHVGSESGSPGISDSDATSVGGVTPGARNVISGNTAAGIRVRSGENHIQANWIGVSPADGATPVGNGIGIEILGGSNYQNIGTHTPAIPPSGPDRTVGRNVISGNLGAGIFTRAGARILANYIGLDPTGRFPVGNGGPGIESREGVLEVGGTGVGDGNVISANAAGVVISGPPLHGWQNTLVNNIIGLDPTGATAMGNAGPGVQVIASDRVVVGGQFTRGRNVISANGVGIDADSRGHEIIGNYVGTDVTGTLARGNRGAGIHLHPDVTQTGLSSRVYDNVISGNGGAGLRIAGGGAVDDQVWGNRIGTNAAGAAALPNLRGVELMTSNRNYIGVANFPPNVIAGNTEDGIFVGAGAAFNSVSDNFIGLGLAPAGGVRPELGNGRHGIFFAEGAGAQNTAARNTIAHNGGAGIFVAAGRQALHPGNSIHSNGGLGIDLAPAGVNLNDGRADPAAPNGGADYPVITGVYPSGNKTLVVGTWSFAASGPPILYLSPQADPSGHGEGAEVLAATAAPVAAPAGDTRYFAYVVDRLLPAGWVVTATSARPFIALPTTSEFSPAFVVPPPDAQTPRVAGVYVRGNWAAPFLQRLESSGAGTVALGYSIPDGAGQLATLPWTDVREVRVKFTEPVNVAADDLMVRGVSGGEYAVGGFAYDAYSFTAKWTVTLAAGGAADRVSFEVDADAAAGVSDLAGSALDGEWADGADAYPSGDGAAGGDFRFAVNVLTGDADRRGGRVTALDVAEVRRRTGTTAAGAGYSLYADLNASGSINSIDLSIARWALDRSLPAASAAPAASPSASPSPAPVRRRGEYVITSSVLPA